MSLPLRDRKLSAQDAPEEVRSLLNIDTVLIEKLAELLQRTGLTEIELSEGEARIRVAKQPAPIAANATVQPAVAMAPEPVQQPAAAASAPAAPAAAADADHPGAVAPMVGTAYLTPEPGADPFVSVGSQVQEGQTLLIVEAMKVMNPIRAPRSGRIASIMITNGDPVEFDELLLIID